jgi:endoglucanase Acf2
MLSMPRSPEMKLSSLQRLLPCLGAVALALALPAHAQPVKLGAGTYFLAPKGAGNKPPAAPFRTEAMLKTAAQTNQWYSTLLFDPAPEPIYAQPISVRATAAGLEFSLPSRQVVPTERKDVEIHYPHADPLLISPVAFEPGTAKLAKAGDWSIDIAFARGADDMRVTVAHGSPYAQLRLSRGDLRVKLPSAGARFDSGADVRTVALKVGGKAYALFGPDGARWEQVSATEWVARMPSGPTHAAIAALPDAQPETLALLARHAHVFVQDTKVDWRVDLAKGQVQTSFSAQTRAMEGPDTGPLLGLYPHHWFGNASVQGRLGPAYDTVRGKLHLLEAPGFTTTATYASFVPYWPRVEGGAQSDVLKDVTRKDVRDARRLLLTIGEGTYWQGKGLQRLVKLMDVTDVQGDTEASAALLKRLEDRVEQWFSGQSDKTYFVHDKTIGTVVGHPEEYFSIEQMNDHYFHYGYWIRAMAEIALRDPAWAAKDRWGGMVDLLVRDIANAQRGGSDFPFLRHFDPYEGHSWASGIGLGAWGNNQESSSEAVNAWAGLILWGEINGDTALRDLGIWMYTTEIESIQHYWFDIHGQVFAPAYKHVETSMVFGAKYAHNTWWTDEPRQIKGINLLPVTTASAYLGRYPQYIERSLATLDDDVASWLSRGKGYSQVPKDIWGDIFGKYLALADPAKALAQWERWGSVELGETRTNTLHWMLSLQQMGMPDFGVTADTPFYAVFRRSDGSRTHLAFNATKAAITVRFSDGKTLQVAPSQLADSRARSAS